jgi:hypothetical protein
MIARLTLLVLWLIPTMGSAQQIPVQMPPLLVGRWNYVAVFLGETVESCGHQSEAKGMTITEKGQIIENDGSRIC